MTWKIAAGMVAFSGVAVLVMFEVYYQRQRRKRLDALMDSYRVQNQGRITPNGKR